MIMTRPHILNPEHKYYVYVYYDMELNPYYVGKGCGNRMNEDHGLLPVPKEKKYKKKIKENLCEQEAFIIESQLIRHFGRILDGGILENIMLGSYDEEQIDDFYHQKRLFNEWKEKFDQYFSSLMSESNAEWESELDKLRHIKHNCPEEWDRIYLNYCGDYYDEDRNEQVEIILNENKNQPAISEIRR